jgi:guanosine-3',5'-bis(diphosphate) 3'-pyrophosphohydrolase
MEDSAKKQLDEEKMVNDAFQHLINTYLASRHRKKVEIITKAFNFAKQATKECAAFPANLTSCIRWP